MHELVSRHTYFSYAGTFASPLVESWGAGGEIMNGMLASMAPFGATLADIEVVDTSARPADHAVVLRLGAYARYQFKLESVDMEVSGLDESHHDRLSGVLAAGDLWIRSGPGKGVPFQSHVFTYATHNEVVNGTASEILMQMSELELSRLGTNRGTGLTFHGELEEGTSTVQLSVDHSMTVENGLFVQLVWVILEDELDHGSTIAAQWDLFSAALADLGMEIST